MSSLQDNRNFYQTYDWSQGGEEWADAWGGSDMQWYATILPRIHNFLPAKRIVEIGAGFGRWVPFLSNHCEELFAVDITRECIEHLTQKYANVSSIRPTLGCGSSIRSVEPRSVDFVFSFHSLVHADVSTMRGYIEDLDRMLTTDGVAFIHHSNAAVYAGQPGFDMASLADYRDISVSGSVVAELASENGLLCVSREEVNWETRETLDCFSVIARPMSLWGRGETCVRNANFNQEMAYWGQLAKIYGRGQSQAVEPWVYNMSKSE